MALPTLGVLDKDGADQTINTMNSGQQPAADSASMTLSTENVASLTALATKLDSVIALIGATNTKVDATNAALTTIDGRVDGLETLVGATNTAVASTNTLLTTQNGYLDGVETAIASTNTKLDTLAGHVDGVETLIGTTNTTLTTQNGYLDGIEALIGTTNTNVASTNTLLTTQNGYLDGLETLITSTNTKLDSANASLDDIETAVESTTPVVNDAGVKYVDVTISADTSAYASGDLIADAQIVAACVRLDDATGALHSIMVLDEDDQGAAFTIYLSSVSTTWGTENSAPTITDTVARSILGFVDVATTDYKDLGGSKVAIKSNCGIAVKPATGTDDIYVAIVNGTGTPTYTASGLKLRFGFLI